jgi:hypothetical protein
LLALSTIEVCSLNGVLISKDNILAACGVKSDEFNHAKKINRNLQVSNNSISNFKDENFDKVLKEVREFFVDLKINSEQQILMYANVLQDIRIALNSLKMDSKYEWVILLYVKIHSDMSSNSHTQKSRIAGAVWCCITKAKLNITEKDVEKEMKVSISTFKSDLCKEMFKILNNCSGPPGGPTSSPHSVLTHAPPK